MSNQHTENHNDNFTFVGALKNNDHFEAIVENKNLEFEHSKGYPIPWRQIHRANVPHLGRRSR